MTRSDPGRGSGAAQPQRFCPGAIIQQLAASPRGPGQAHVLNKAEKNHSLRQSSSLQPLVLCLVYGGLFYFALASILSLSLPKSTRIATRTLKVVCKRVFVASLVPKISHPSHVWGTFFSYFICCFKAPFGPRIANLSLFRAASLSLRESQVLASFKVGNLHSTIP